MSPKIDLPPQKKLEGSFLKRNWWIFVVFVAVSVVGAAMWFIYKQVRATERVYRSFGLSVPDSAVVDTSVSLKSFRVDYVSGLKTATLNVKGNSAVYRVADTTNELFYAEETGNLYHIHRVLQSANATLNFNPDTLSKTFFRVKQTDTITIRLNLAPVWSVNLDAGGGDANFDFSKFKLKSMKLNGGAGEFKVRLEQPLEATNIDVSTGAADVTLEVPKNAACRIHVNSTLSSTEFNGFQKKSDGVYETAGFDKSKNKLDINVESAISDIKIRKY